MSSTRLWLTVALVAVTALAFASPASAARGLDLGFADPLYHSPSDRNLWLDRSSEARARIVKLFSGWDGLVSSEPANPRDPDDPAYSFAGLDSSVRAARSRGFEVLIGVQGAPAWAEGAKRAESAPPGTWKPSPNAFEDFMAALAKRYSGSYPDPKGGTLPRVRNFQIWNEANLSTYLTPQWKGKRPVGAQHYKKLLNAAYDGAHAVNKNARVVTTGLAPYGDEPGGLRSRPLEFWREIFCLQGRKRLRAAKRCPNKARFDVFAHHPINTSGPPRKSALDPDDASSGDLPVVTRTLRAAERQRTVGGGRRHELWATEIWWESDPPSKDGYALKTQARFIQETMYLSWKAGFSAAIQLRIRDSPRSASAGSRTADGLYFLSGKPKPSARAFRFPFVADPGKGSRVSVWGKAPHKGKVVIERLSGKRWQRVGRAKAGKTRVFSARLKVKGNPKLRARADGQTSLPWKLR